MKRFILLFSLVFCLAISACNSPQQKHEDPFAENELEKTSVEEVNEDSLIISEINRLMNEQEEQWNSGNLEGYMEHYRQDDSLMFVGSKGITYGWEQTLENYKKGYPDTAAMGKLSFENIEVQRLNETNAFVVGRWHLARTSKDLSGYYTLLWKRIDKKWVIVADHSS